MDAVPCVQDLARVWLRSGAMRESQSSRLVALLQPPPPVASIAARPASASVGQRAPAKGAALNQPYDAVCRPQPGGSLLICRAGRWRAEASHVVSCRAAAGSRAGCEPRAQENEAANDDRLVLAHNWRRVKWLPAQEEPLPLELIPMADAESRKPSAKDVADFKDAERLSRMQSKAKALETVSAVNTKPPR